MFIDYVLVNGRMGREWRSKEIVFGRVVLSSEVGIFGREGLSFFYEWVRYWEGGLV